uniref:Ig-like domain-containing protein n=1 Tax=Dicentrarchus labrax TaxID=13489 RepID=A0A8P4K9E2_DICLA
MGHTLLCVLGLLLLNTFLCRHAEGQNNEDEITVHMGDVQTGQNNVSSDVGDGKKGGDAILEIPDFTLFEGDSVTLRCRHQGTPRNELKATFFKDGSSLQMATNHQSVGTEAMTIYPVSVSDGGAYKCQFDDGAESEPRQLKVEADKRQVTLTADKTIIPPGGSVTLTCSVENPAGFKYEWFRQTSDTDTDTKTRLQSVNFDDSHTVIRHGGRYTCRGWRREPEVLTPESDAVTIQETVPNRAILTLEPNWPQIFSGETITLRCEIQGGGDTQWTYEWEPTSSNTQSPTHSESRIISATESHSGDYRCKGRKDSYSSTEWSDYIKLTTSPQRPKAQLRADDTDIPVGGSVTLTCSVNPSSSGWKYFLYRVETTPEPLTTPDGVFLSTGQIRVSQGGLYWCRGGRGDTLYYTEYSDPIRIIKIFAKPVVTLQPNWSEIYDGEKITLRCEIMNRGNTQWTYEWIIPKSNTPLTNNEYSISRAQLSDSGDYSCKGRRDSYSSTDWSDAIRLTVSSQRPKAQLRADGTDIPVGGSVTLTCSVNPSSSGWKYFLYRVETTPEPLTTPDVVFLSTGQIRVSQGGLYWCRGGRGDTVYYTEYSDSISIYRIIEKPVVTLQPNWPEIYYGEKITLRCEIKDRGNTQWTYEWKTPKSNTRQTNNEYSISRAQLSDSGDYRCKGRDSYSSTDWSDYIRLTVSSQTPKAQLRADGTDIPVGGSVTLTCSVNPSSSGWKYFWYKGKKTSEPLTTPDGVFLSTGQIRVSQGGLYWCRGGRGVPVYYTEYSDPISISKIFAKKSVVTLQPNWSEIYDGEKITLRCEIMNSRNTQWTFEWKIPKSNTHLTNNEYSINSAERSHSGDYSCKGRRDSYYSTDWSDAITLTVSSQTPKAQLRADDTDIPVGGSVILTCSVNPSSGWKYFLYRGETTPEPLTTPDGIFLSNGQIRVSQGGLYRCRGGRGDSVYYTEYSDPISVNKILAKKSVVTLQPNWSEIYDGEKITLRCEIMNSGNTQWTFEWKIPKSNTHLTNNEYSINSAEWSHSGDYRCKGRRDSYYSTDWSDAITLTVTSRRPKAQLRADGTDIPVGGSVTLTCSVNLSSSGWKYFWYRGEKYSRPIATQNVSPLSTGQIRVSQGGLYWCRGGRGDPVYPTDYSDSISINNDVANKAVVTLQPNWSEIYSGEKITLRCEIKDGGDTEWTYEWKTTSSRKPSNQDEHTIWFATVSHSGEYSCKGRRDSYSSTDWSDAITLTVSSQTPKAELRADDTDIPVGGSVTLTCSVNPSSSGWKYFWYREKTSEPLTTPDVVFLSTGQISVSQGGLYWCRGGRGDPVYYTEYSDPISIYKTLANKAVVTLQPNWSEIYSGEKITLRCEIKDGGDTEWTYEWKTTSSRKPSNQNEHRIWFATVSHSGEYSCKGRMKHDQQSSTEWSDPIKLTVLDRWRFFWYKAVPDLSSNYYSSELLPGSSNGTEQDSYIVHGQTHTAGYKCRVGRGDPVYYTQDSKPKFVWSGDLHPSASLTVSPDRVQHFTSDSVSVNCEGNSTEWRVRTFKENSYWSYCSSWGTMNGSTCNIDSYWQSDAVYWCESGSGEFSNAVNITIQKTDIILVSPVHPVNEGDSVSLSCRLRKQTFESNVFFYLNEKLIQNDTRRELNISAVSKSDEGFYKCQYSQRMSAQSWMSVNAVSRPESSPFPLPLIVGLVCGIILIIILLLLLYRYRPSKGPCFIRSNQSESINQDSNTNHVVNQNEAQCDAPLYESIKGSEDTGNDDNLVYAQVNYHNKGKAKRNTGNSPPGATADAVYSEVKPGTALGNNAAI